MQQTLSSVFSTANLQAQNGKGTRGATSPSGRKGYLCLQECPLVASSIPQDSRPGKHRGKRILPGRSYLFFIATYAQILELLEHSRSLHNKFNPLILQMKLKHKKVKCLTQDIPQFQNLFKLQPHLFHPKEKTI